MLSFDEWKKAGKFDKNKDYSVHEPGICRDCGTPTFAKAILYCEKCLANRN